MMFLNNLLKKYENIYQLLKFHIKNLNQMIKSLSTAEAWMKNEKEILYKINIATELARQIKAEWLKIAKYYNYKELEHLARNYKTLKKNCKNDEKADKINNKKIKEKAEKKIKKLIN